MPFGPYEDFDDCVSKNSDKDDPKAYCAIIKRNIEGDGNGGNGSDHSELPSWVSINMFAEGDSLMRTIDVFRAGTHTDSSGVTRHWGMGDLRNMVAAFNAGVPGRVPIKVGHTTDKFNRSLAEKMGLPTDILVGEGGEGAASLGRITKLYVSGEGDAAVLRANVELSPPLSRLLDDKLFGDVSAEIFDHRSNNGVEYGPVLSAVAVLGAERPAVKDLVAFGTKLDDKLPDRVLAFKASFDETPAATEVAITSIDQIGEVYGWWRRHPRLRRLALSMAGGPFLEAFWGGPKGEAEVRSAKKLYDAALDTGDTDTIRDASELYLETVNRYGFQEHGGNGGDDEDCVKKHMGDGGMSREDAVAKCKKMKQQMREAAAAWRLSTRQHKEGEGIARYLVVFAIGTDVEDIYVYADSLEDAVDKASKQFQDSFGVDPDDVLRVEVLTGRYGEMKQLRMSGRHREAANALSNGMIPDGAFDAAEDVMRGAFKDALLSGKVQRSGWGNTIRAAWGLLQESVLKGFSEPTSSAFGWGGQVASVIISPPIAKSHDDVVKWLIDHRYEANDWEIKQLGTDWVMRPVSADMNPNYTYGQISVGAGITAIVGTPSITGELSKGKYQTYDRGDAMVTERELRKALGIGLNEDLVVAVKKLKEASTFSEAMADTVKSLDHDRLVMRYSEHTTLLTTVAGTPRELAEQLAKLEESVGERVARDLLIAWQGVQAAANRAGVLSAFSKPSVNGSSNASHPFEIKVKSVAEKDNLTIPVAMVRMARLDPSGFHEYNNAVARGEHRATI